jgi:outer membrane protein OmpU
MEKNEEKKMKNILLTTTAMVMTAGVAAADVSFSGAAGAGISSTGTTNTAVWSGIDLNVSASVTTDSGMTISVGEDFGGGSLADWDDDYAIEDQTSDFDQPTVKIAFGSTTISLEDGAIDDLYDDDQSGDVGISTTVGGASVGMTLDTDAAAGAPSFSYNLAMPLGGLSLSANGTDADGAGNAANELAASYAMGDMTLTLSTDDKGSADSINKLKVATNVGGAAVSVSADDNDDWDLSVGYSEGSISLNVSTDENAAWETNVSVDLGGGAAFRVSATDADEFVAAGVTFSF